MKKRQVIGKLPENLRSEKLQPKKRKPIVPSKHVAPDGAYTILIFKPGPELDGREVYFSGHVLGRQQVENIMRLVSDAQGEGHVGDGRHRVVGTVTGRLSSREGTVPDVYRVLDQVTRSEVEMARRRRWYENDQHHDAIQHGLRAAPKVVTMKVDENDDDIAQAEEEEKEEITEEEVEKEITEEGVEVEE